MCKKLSEWINRISNTGVVLVCLVVFLLFSALVLPDQATKAEVYSDGAGSPDTSLFYTAESLYQMAEAYGPAGRRSYIQARFTFDIVWPLVYVIFLATAISWLNKRAAMHNKLWGRLNLVPIMGMLFDFFENISAAIVMARYPHPTVLIDHLAGVFTLVKWIFIGGSFIVLIFGVALVTWRVFQTRSQ